MRQKTHSRSVSNNSTPVPLLSRAEGNPAGLKQRLETAVVELGLKAQGVDKLPEVKTHELAVPRIAIVHTWTNTQNEGWFRIEFDRLQIPYTYISDHVIRNTPNLREKFDVLIFPPVGGSAQTIVNGMPRRGEPIPWKTSALTPNFAQSPDQTDDMRGGMGVSGVANLQKFIEDGGLFITIGNTCADTDRLRHHQWAFRFKRPISCRLVDQSTTRLSPIERAQLPMAMMPTCRSTSTSLRCSRLRRVVAVVVSVAVVADHRR